MRTIQTFSGKLIPEFLNSMSSEHLSVSTRRGYSFDLRHFGRFLSDLHHRDFNLSEVGEEDLKAYRYFLVEEKQQNFSSVNRRIATLRKFFRWAYENSQVRSDMSGVLRFMRRRGKCKKQTLCANDILRLLQSAGSSSHGTGRRNYAIIKLMLETGLRVGQVTELTPANISLYSRSGFLIPDPDNRAERPMIPLSRALRSALSECLDFRKKCSCCDRLFVSKRGTPLSPRTVLHMIKTAVNRAGLPGKHVTGEMLRAYFIENSLRSDPDCVGKLAAVLGLRSPSALKKYMSRPA